MVRDRLVATEMSDVTRYEVELYDGPNGGVIGKMKPSENGAYVLHHDFLALALRLDNTLGSLEIAGKRIAQLEVDVKMHSENTDRQHDRALDYMRERDAAVSRLSALVIAGREWCEAAVKPDGASYEDAVRFRRLLDESAVEKHRQFPTEDDKRVWDQNEALRNKSSD